MYVKPSPKNLNIGPYLPHPHKYNCLWDDYRAKGAWWLSTTLYCLMDCLFCFRAFIIVRPSQRKM